MSTPPIHQNSGEQDLVQALLQAIYENSTNAVFFHTAVAEQLGIGATEEKTLLILSGGPLTAGEIAQATGLTTASVTSLIDRLERKGFVRRVRDSADRRRVIVEPIAEKLTDLTNIFGSMEGVFEDLRTVYSVEQLETIIDFLKRMTARSREAILRLSAKTEAANKQDVQE